MRVTPEHLATIREAVEPLDTPERRVRYRNGGFPRAYAVLDLDKRYRWDLFYAAPRTEALRAVIDGGYFDSHLDTALRLIVRPL